MTQLNDTQLSEPTDTSDGDLEQHVVRGMQLAARLSTPDLQQLRTMAWMHDEVWARVLGALIRAELRRRAIV